MMLNQWQLNFLRRLVELGGSISSPDGVVNQELIELIEADYVLEGDGRERSPLDRTTNLSCDAPMSAIVQKRTNYCDAAIVR